MIRIAVGYLVIVIGICAVIVMDPLGWIAASKPLPRVVGGAVSDSAVPSAAPGAAPGAAPASQADTDRVAAALALASVAPAALPSPQPAPAPSVTGVGLAPAAIAPDATVEAATAAILAALREAQAPAVPDAAFGAVAAPVSTPQPDPATGQPTGQPTAATLHSLVAQALRDGQSETAIDQLVNQAAGSGLVTVPAGLISVDGRVDTALLLASIAGADDDGFGEGDRSDPSAPIADDPVSARLDREDVLYTIRVGESLGSLALRFYGDADEYVLIYNANRGTLPTPDSVRVGQRLLIPRRPGL
jgi:nucleoid-associated protein YgaU